MEHKIIFIIGLPGSGKTKYLKKHFSYNGFCIFDDYQGDAINDNSDFTYSRNYPFLINSLNVGKTCIISDIKFCVLDERLKAEKILIDFFADIKIEYYCFENNPEQCIINATRRAEKKIERSLEPEISNIKSLSLNYVYPLNYKLISVYKS